MSVIVIEAGKNGKIELTKGELQDMLDKAYEEGRASAERHCWRCQPWYVNTTTTPVTTWNSSGTTISADSVTL